MKTAFVAVVLFATVAFGQDVDPGGGLEEKCQEAASITPTTVTIQKIQSERNLTDVPSSKMYASCHSSTHVGAYVKVEGIVTAHGAHKGSYAQDYFFMQTGTDKFSGIEVFSEGHYTKLSPGQKVSVTGFVAENPPGLTIIQACKLPDVVSSGNDIPAPVVLKASVFHGANCNEDIEAYEGMLVKIENVTTVKCSNSYCSGGIKATDASSWDKYKQMWFTDDDGTSIVEVDNHMFDIFTRFITVPGTAFGFVQGVLSWYSDTDNNIAGRDDSHWDLLPRSAADVGGGVAIPTDAIKPYSVADVQQLTYQYGNNLASVPELKVGKDVAVKSGKMGTGNWEHGPCPNSTMQAWMYTKEGKAVQPMTHSLCACYPAGALTDLGKLAGEYVSLRARVAYTQGPLASFYLEEEDCSKKTGRGMFVYRPGGTEDDKLAAGDVISILSKTYQYYGSEQGSDPIKITIEKTGTNVCPPTEVTAKAFHVPATVSDDTGHGEGKLGNAAVKTPGATAVADTGDYCKKCVAGDAESCAEQYEGQFVQVKYVKVVGFTKDWYKNYGGLDTEGKWSEEVFHVDGKKMTLVAGSVRGPYQNHACSGVAGGCQMIVEDQNGHQMLIDNKHKGTEKFFKGTVPGKEEQTIKVGDTFTSVKCIVDQHRGEYPLGRGGHYDCNPVDWRDMAGWNEEWPSEDDKDDSTLIIAIVVPVVVVALAIVGFAMYKFGYEKAGQSAPAAKVFGPDTNL